MWDLAVREEDYAGAARMIERYRGAPPPSYRMLLARAMGDSQAFAALLAAGRTEENRQLQIGARYLALYLGDFTLALEVVERDLEWRERPAIRQDTRLLAGWLELARGRWSAGRMAFEAADAEGSGAALVHRAIAAALPFLAVPTPELTAIHRELEAWEPGRDPPDRTALVTALRPHLRLYLLGLLESRLGKVPEALARAAELGRLRPPPGGAQVVQALAATIRADVEWSRGRAAAVLTQLDAIRPDVPLELVSLPAFATVREYGMEHARWLRAAALTSLGRAAEARRWLEFGFLGAPNEVVFSSPANGLLAEAAARAGDQTAAARHLDRMAVLWSEADLPLQQGVAETRRRVQGPP